MKTVTKKVLDRLEQAKGLEALRSSHPGCDVVQVAPDLVIICEDIKKPWQEGGPTVVPEPRKEHPRSKSAELPGEKHPIDVEVEKRKLIDDFWNGLK